MAKTVIEFTKSAPVGGRWYHVGEVAGFDADVAAKVIEAGRAKPHGAERHKPAESAEVTKPAEPAVSKSDPAGGIPRGRRRKR